MATNRKPTQSDRVLQYMEMFGSITPLQALEDLGVMRLAPRIAELEDRGIMIRHESYAFKNRFGEKGRCCRYSLEVAHDV